MQIILTTCWLSGERPLPFGILVQISSSETTQPIKAKFRVEHPWEGGTKVCINGPGHMTKMAVMPIYGTLDLLLQNEKSCDMKVGRCIE